MMPQLMHGLERNAPPALERLTKVVGAALIDRPDTDGGAALVISASDWDELWPLLERDRVGGLVAATVRSKRVALPAAAQKQVQDHAQSVAMLRLQLLSAQHHAVAALDAAGIQSLVLKGLATGPLDYPEESMRHTADVDLLVRPRDFERARQVFLDQGMVDDKEDLPVHLLVESTFRNANGVEIDLHHRLFRFGPPGDDLLFENPVELPDDGGLALPAEGRLLHAAAHLLISPPGTRRLQSLFDVTLLRARDDIDLDKTLELAAHFGMEGIVEFAIWLSDSLTTDDDPPPPKVARTWINRAYLRTERSIPLETCAVLADLNGMKDRIDYLRYQLPKLRSGT